MPPGYSVCHVWCKRSQSSQQGGSDVGLDVQSNDAPLCYAVAFGRERSLSRHHDWPNVPKCIKYRVVWTWFGGFPVRRSRDSAD
jgi:hypothetical protein